MLINFFNSNFFVGLITLLVGGVAIVIYVVQRYYAKRDASRIILQEIRRAEDIISDYKRSGGYQFAKKIIAINSWNKNIHYFVDDLDNDEMDKISELYSTGEYLDSFIQDISRITLHDEVEREKVLLAVEMSQLNQPQNQQQVTNVGSTYPIAQIGIQPQILVPGIRPIWKNRLDIISLKLTPIYDSTITLKLKKMAKLF